MGKTPKASVMYSIVAAAMFSTAAGKALWSSQPAVTSDFIRTAYVLGNGKLGGKYNTVFFSRSV